MGAPGRCYGYAFANFISSDAAQLALRSFETPRQRLGLAQQQCLGVTWGRLQGLAAHIDRFRNSPVMHWNVPNEARPAIFCGGVQTSFPAPTKRLLPPGSSKHLRCS